MKKINNKGFTIIEIILSFSFIMTISVALFASATNYKNKQQEASKKRDLEAYKVAILTDVHKDVDEKGLKEITKKSDNNYTLKFCDDTEKSLFIFTDTSTGKKVGLVYGNNYYMLKDKDSYQIESINHKFRNTINEYLTSKTTSDHTTYYNYKLFKITISIKEMNTDEIFNINFVFSTFYNTVIEY